MLLGYTFRQMLSSGKARGMYYFSGGLSKVHMPYSAWVTCATAGRKAGSSATKRSLPGSICILIERRKC